MEKQVADILTKDLGKNKAQTLLYVHGFGVLIEGVLSMNDSCESLHPMLQNQEKHCNALQARTNCYELRCGL